MGAKVSKLASLHVAGVTASAFSSFVRWCKKMHKLYQDMENHDDIMRIIYGLFKCIVSAHNLNREFYPLSWEDYASPRFEHVDLEYDCAIRCISIIHPLMIKLHKLDKSRCLQLIDTMRKHIMCLMLQDFNVGYLVGDK